MSPPISKDWWLAAALTSAALPTALAQPAVQPAAVSAPGVDSAGRPASYTVKQGDSLTRIGTEVGVDWRDLALWNGIANPDVIPVGLVLRLTAPEGMTTSARARASVVSPSARAGARKPPIYVSESRGQRITTGPGETTHVLFSDQSAITVGPNSEVVITEYQYTPPPPQPGAPQAAPQPGTGRLLLQMPKGILRVVGGLLSKRADTLVKTPTATIGIRGGISIVEHGDDNTTKGTFLFGDHMIGTHDASARSQSVYRPGFGVRIDQAGISEALRIMREEMARQLALVQAEPPAPDLPLETPDPNATRQVEGVAPDRVAGPEGLAAPTLSDILGSKAPGNQS